MWPYYIGDGANNKCSSGVSKSIESGKGRYRFSRIDYTSALRSQAISRNFRNSKKD